MRWLRARCVAGGGGSRRRCGAHPRRSDDDGAARDRRDRLGEVAVLGRASTRPPPSQRCSMRSRRVTRSASAASSSSTSEEIVCATASSSASSPPGLADVLFRELLVLVLEHVPAESLLALCETSREFGVLAREVGAARMKHAPRWAARALRHRQPAPPARPRRAGAADLRLVVRRARRDPPLRGARPLPPAPARRRHPRAGTCHALCAAARATALALAPSPSLTPPPPPPPQLRADPTLQAGEGGAGGSACDARYPELLSAMAFGMRAAATLAAARRAHAAAEARASPTRRGSRGCTRRRCSGRRSSPRSSASPAARMRGYWSQSSSMKTPGRPASPPRRSGSSAPRRARAPSPSARWWMRCSTAAITRSRRGRAPSRKWRGGTRKRSERCCRLRRFPVRLAAPSPLSPRHPSPRTPLLTLAPSLLPAALVSLLRSASDRSRRNGAAALKSLAKRDPNAAKAMVSAGAVPALVDLLQSRRRDAAPPFRPPDPPHSSHVPPFPFRRRVSRSPRARGRCCVRSAVTCRKCGSRGSLSRGVATN